VFEETGIRSNFSSILCFWNRHGLTWGQSDIYVVCRLEPENNEIRIDPSEIEDCVWMPLSDFVENEDHFIPLPRSPVAPHTITIKNVASPLTVMVLEGPSADFKGG